MQDEGHRNARRDILRYAGRNVHDGNGALHPILRGGRQKPPTFFREHDGEKESRQRNLCPNLRYIVFYQLNVFTFVKPIFFTKSFIRSKSSEL